MNDDPTSISQRSDSLTPKEGLLVSANFAAGFSDHLKLTGEIAGSGFTDNVNAESVDFTSPVPGSLLTQNISTRADYAGALALDWNNASWGIKTSGKYIGAGYVAIGYPYLTPDRMEVLVAPRLALFNNGLNISGSGGYRVNNLSQTKGATSTQIVASANVVATFSEEFSVASQYGNFGMHNTEKNDTLRIENVSNSFSISPTYVRTASYGMHMLSATYSRDAFTDYNTVTGALGSNNTRMLQGLYSLSLTSTPLTVMMNVSNLWNILATEDVTMNSATIQLGYQLLEGKLVPTVSGTYSESSLNKSPTPMSPGIQYSPDIQRLLRAGLRWQLAKFLALGVSASTTNFSYGGQRPGVSFQETLVSSSISATF